METYIIRRLAHCKQMNHSKAFWAVRNNYADQMRLLWGRGYTGEGLWGRGALLGSGEWEKNTVQPGELLPEHLCGGTYRSRRRKRKAKKTPTYQERKERRILKKFGANGVALGEDEEQKRALEKGRRVVAKPRVAGSARGRELRAAAALARFDQQKKEELADDDVKVKGESVGDDEGDETASEAESGSDYDDADDNQPDATGADGKKILDEKGRGMIKVCEDENPDDHDARNELLELQSTQQQPASSDSTSASSYATVGKPTTTPRSQKFRDGKNLETRQPEAATRTDRQRFTGGKLIKSEEPHITSEAPPPVPETRSSTTAACAVCSFANEELAVTCGVCGNVLDPVSMAGAWQCHSEICAGSRYVNAGDCGVCGVCHARRSSTSH